MQCSTSGGCFAAKPIQAGQSVTGTTVSGTNTTANAVTGYTCYGLSESGREAAFIFTPTTTGNYRIDLTGLSNDCDLFVVNTNNCNGTCLTGSSASTSGGGSSEAVTITGTQNVSYFIVVDGYAGNTCNFTLSVTAL